MAPLRRAEAPRSHEKHYLQVPGAMDRYCTQNKSVIMRQSIKMPCTCLLEANPQVFQSLISHQNWNPSHICVKKGAAYICL
jgi:hypothetical protein